MDLTIPGGMGGRETIQQLLAIDPDARAIVSSGYSEDTVLADHRSFGFRGAVRKPYRLRDLSEVVAAVLRDGGRRP
jgi:DNA-binding NarL/FixJ family response regulator